jgi:hypothetical protein
VRTQNTTRSRPRRATWRKRLLNWHRDVGFLVFGLTVTYAISGLAVNHHHQWNYNESTTRTRHAVGRPHQLLAALDAGRFAELEAAPAAITDEETAALVAVLGTRLGYPTTPRNYFWRSPSRLLAFYGEGDREVIEYSPTTGTAELIVRRERSGLRDLNYLHLNEARNWWTWVADGYAVLLLFLATSGALIVRGRKGLTGRGGVLLSIGIAVPLLGVLLMRYF